MNAEKHKDNKVEIQYEFAYNSDKVPETISEAKKTNKYYCPYCATEMVARQGVLKVWHFAHKFIPDDSMCIGNGYSTEQEKIMRDNITHSFAVDILIKFIKTKTVEITQRCNRCFTKTKKVFDADQSSIIHKEYRLEDGIADIVLEQDGELFIFEVFNTHKTKERKNVWWCEISADSIIESHSQIKEGDYSTIKFDCSRRNIYCENQCKSMADVAIELGFAEQMKTTEYYIRRNEKYKLFGWCGKSNKYIEPVKLREFAERERCIHCCNNFSSVCKSEGYTFNVESRGLSDKLEYARKMDMEHYWQHVYCIECYVRITDNSKPKLVFPREITDEEREYAIQQIAIEDKKKKEEEEMKNKMKKIMEEIEKEIEKEENERKRKEEEERIEQENMETISSRMEDIINRNIFIYKLHRYIHDLTIAIKTGLIKNIKKECSICCVDKLDDIYTGIKDIRVEFDLLSFIKECKLNQYFEYNWCSRMYLDYENAQTKTIFLGILGKSDNTISDKSYYLVSKIDDLQECIGNGFIACNRTDRLCRRTSCCSFEETALKLGLLVWVRENPYSETKILWKNGSKTCEWFLNARVGNNELSKTFLSLNRCIRCKELNNIKSYKYFCIGCYNYISYTDEKIEVKATEEEKEMVRNKYSFISKIPKISSEMPCVSCGETITFKKRFGCKPFKYFGERQICYSCVKEKYNYD